MQKGEGEDAIQTKEAEIMPNKKRIVRVDRSPLNPKRWCLMLECGHEEWVTATAKPKKKE